MKRSVQNNICKMDNLINLSPTKQLSFAPRIACTDLGSLLSLHNSVSMHSMNWHPVQ